MAGYQGYVAFYKDGIMKIEEKVALCAIKHHEESHIKVDEDACKRCETKICVRSCPAHLYTIEPETGELKVDHTGCLECGTCLIICPLKAVTWTYPQPGFGIYYRYG